MSVQFETPTSKILGIVPLEEPIYRFTSDVPLSILIYADGNIHLNYRTDLFNRSDIKSMGELFCRAVPVLLNPQRTVAMCLDDLISHSAREELRRIGNCGSRLTSALSVKDDLISVFQRAVLENPSNIAIEEANVSLSYLELDLLSTKVASYILPIIEPQEIVCVHADGSVNCIVAIYGVLKAGGVYCPLDQALPSDLRDMYFRSTGSRIFLSPSVVDISFRPKACDLHFAVEEILQESESSCREPYSGTYHPSSYRHAYLCFTSGSTGKPKQFYAAMKA